MQKYLKPKVGYDVERLYVQDENGVAQLANDLRGDGSKQTPKERPTRIYGEVVGHAENPFSNIHTLNISNYDRNPALSDLFGDHQGCMGRGPKQSILKGRNKKFPSSFRGTKQLEKYVTSMCSKHVECYHVCIKSDSTVNVVIRDNKTGLVACVDIGTQKDCVTVSHKLPKAIARLISNANFHGLKYQTYNFI